MIVDDNPIDPREWDNLGKMVCWHGRYNLGDKHSYSCDEFLRELSLEVRPELEVRFDRLENEVCDRLVEKWKCYLSNTHTCQDKWSVSNKVQDKVYDKVNKIIEKTLDDNFIILPLYLYDHSGLTMGICPFSCIFDSGQVGYIYCKKGEGTEENLQAEVKTYSQYLEGDVYGFVVEENDEVVDSCYGFYGSDPRENGMSEHLMEKQLEILLDNQ
jgi:hypothetical protein